MHDFAELLDRVGKSNEKQPYLQRAQELAEAIENKAWDGEWYHRAYFDDGTPLGSKNSPEAKIDSIAQSWAVISGAGSSDRAFQALLSAEKALCRDGISRLLTPPFDQAPHDPGYIKGYPPGVRENGGQYTHGSLWLPMALARIGQGEKAVALLQMMNPINHALTIEQADHYKIEPYAVAGDIYDLAQQVGRGGWSWYTGAASWMYRIWMEEVLGFQLRGAVLRINPVVTASWNGFKINYRYGNTTYHIVVERDDPAQATPLPYEIPLVDDGQVHEVLIRLVPGTLIKDEG
jgi:cellobiose phosphorylase